MKEYNFNIIFIKCINKDGKVSFASLEPIQKVIFWVLKQLRI